MKRLQVPPVYTRLTKTADQTGIVSGTITLVNWDAVDTNFNTGEITASASSDNITIKTPGVYLINVSIHWAGEATSNNSTRRMLYIEYGTSYQNVLNPSWVEQNVLAGSQTAQTACVIVSLAKDDLVRVRVLHGSSANRTILAGSYTTFTMTKLPIFV